MISLKVKFQINYDKNYITKSVWSAVTLNVMAKNVEMKKLMELGKVYFV